MKNYYEDFIKYASQLILNNDDYGNRLKVITHNRAMRKLLLLKKEMKEIKRKEKKEEEKKKFPTSGIEPEASMWEEKATKVKKWKVKNVKSEK